MTAAKDFASAISQALELSERHDEALRLVEQLTRELAETVQKQTLGLVAVNLVPADSFGVFPVLLAGEAIADRLRKRELGTDAEDRGVRQFVIARIDSGASRVLWEVALADGGYPVTITGPDPDASVSCFGEEDVRAAFVQAAGHGTVGRKLAALIRQAKRPTPSDSGSPDLG